MTSCWIGVAAGNHVAAGVAGGFAMFEHGRREAVERILPDDWVAYYSPREGMREGRELRAFTAIGRVGSGSVGLREMGIGQTGWSRRMQWLDSRAADIYPLLDRFSFVADRRHWGMYFRKSLFAVSKHDFAIVAQAMTVGDQFESAGKQE